MMMDNQLLLSVEEAAELLRLGRTRTYELVMTRKIQSVKVGATPTRGAKQRR
jgi:excisionase family DNA binding protein